MGFCVVPRVLLSKHHFQIEGSRTKIVLQQVETIFKSRFAQYAMIKSSILRLFFTPTLALVILLDLKERALAIINNNVTNGNSRSCSSQAVTTSKVNVWNNVIDTDNLASILHKESSRIGLGHKVFSRPSSSNSIIEQTLDSILAELNDDSKYVEYWTRREWRSIQAHADIDEYRAKQEQQSGEISNKGYRYPKNGHVLYLQVGTQVRGPTAIFPNRKSGGDLLRNLVTESLCVDSDERSNSQNKHIESSGQGSEDEGVQLITVPAVPGRLLRFQGDYLHAVPRPTDLWLLKFVKGSPTFEPEEDWGRSVILFNTWNDEPPLGIPIDEESPKDATSRDLNQSRESRYDCNKRGQWSSVTTHDLNTESREDDCQQQQQPLSTKIWLLGDYRRRDHTMQTVKLEGSESLREALFQESKVMSTKLKIP